MKGGKRSTGEVARGAENFNTSYVHGQQVQGDENS